MIAKTMVVEPRNRRPRFPIAKKSKSLFEHTMNKFGYEKMD
jgi:hypothetical protein